MFGIWESGGKKEKGDIKSSFNTVLEEYQESRTQKQNHNHNQDAAQ